MRRGAGGRLRSAACAVFALAALFAAQPVSAQATQRGFASAKSQAVIQTPGSIAKVYDMDFGKVAQNTLGGKVVMTAADNAVCTTTGGLIHVGACRAAAFSVYGKRNWKVRIRNNNPASITLNGPSGATMQLTNVTFSQSGLTATSGANGWNLGRYDINTVSGFAEIWLGGTLNVGPAQRAGVYRGTVLVEVQFN